MSCDSYLWLPCEDGTCRQCGNSEGYATKAQCMTNHAKLPAVNCREYCDSTCYNAKSVRASSLLGNQDALAICPYSQLGQSWGVQKKYST